MLIANRPQPGRLALAIDWLDIFSYASETDVCMFFGLQRQADGTTLGYRSITDPLDFGKGRLFSLGQDVKVLKERIPVLTKKSLEKVKQKPVGRGLCRMVLAAPFFQLVSPTLV